MWYHYLILLVGLYLVGSSIYNIVASGNRSGWIVNGISAAIGGAMAWWAWSGIMAPPPSMFPAPIMGGRRRWRY